jgi:hypothetical protein
LFSKYPRCYLTPMSASALGASAIFFTNLRGRNRRLRNLAQILFLNPDKFFQSETKWPIAFHGFDTNFYARSANPKYVYSTRSDTAKLMIREIVRVNTKIHEMTGIAKKFVIHIDDGDVSVFRVLDELVNSRLEVTFFLNNFDENSKFENRKFLSLKQVEYLLEASPNFGVGFHGGQHLNYSRLDLSVIQSDVASNLEFLMRRYESSRIRKEFSLPFSSATQEGLDFLSSLEFERIWGGFPKGKPNSDLGIRLMVTRDLKYRVFERFIGKAIASVSLNLEE